MISDKALTHSGVLRFPDMVVTSSERRIEHRSILQWGFTHHLQKSGRLGVEVGYVIHSYFTPISLHEFDNTKRIQVENMEVDGCGCFTHLQSIRSDLVTTFITYALKPKDTIQFVS